MGTSGRTWVEGSHAKSSVATWVSVPPEKVFAYVADMARHREWALDEITVTPVSPGPVGLGSRFRSVGRQLGKEWPSELEVTAYEPSDRFEFTATGGPLPSPDGDPHRHEFLLTPERGGTRLELRRTDPAPPNWPGLAFRLLGPLLVRSTLGKRTQTVERLRLRLEQLPGDG